MALVQNVVFISSPDSLLRIFTFLAFYFLTIYVQDISLNLDDLVCVCNIAVFTNFNISSHLLGIFPSATHQHRFQTPFQINYLASHYSLAQALENASTLCRTEQKRIVFHTCSAVIVILRFKYIFPRQTFLTDTCVLCCYA